MPALNPLHIFKAGTWRDHVTGRSLTFSAADLAATAAAYDPARHEAPLVVGHPATDDPAYGWVQSLMITDDGLEATPRQVEAAFAEMVNAERFNRISAGFFLPTAPSNPVPGVYYLKHVGFLGAVPPAVKGLRKPSFNLADSSESVTVEFSFHSSSEATIVPDAPNTPPSGGGQSADFAAQVSALETSNAELKRQLEQRDAEIAAGKARQLRSELTAFAETLIQEGRLLPRDQAGLVEFMAAIPADQVIEFADGDQVVKPNVNAWLKDFLKRLPVQVDFSERTAGAGVVFPVPGLEPQKAEFAASTDLQAEFGTEERYLAYKRAVADGRAKIHGETR